MLDCGQTLKGLKSREGVRSSLQVVEQKEGKLRAGQGGEPGSRDWDAVARAEARARGLRPLGGVLELK